MDNKVGRSNLKKFRTYNPSSSNPSTSSQPPTGTNQTVASNQTVNPVQYRKSRWPSQAATPRPSPLPARTKVPTSDSGRSTPSTTSNPPVQLPAAHRRPASALLTTSPLLSTLGSRVRGAQTPIATTEQSSQHAGISPLLAVIKDQQTAILTQNATFDLSLRDLVAELGKLSDRMKQKEEDTKEREAKEKAKEEKEQGQLKALAILAQGVDDVRKRVIGIENVVGVSKVQEGDKMTMLDRLQNIEMNVEEWLERVRDPDAAAIPLDQRGSIQPPTPSSLSPAAPSVVRHEMAVSPFKLSATTQAVSRTPETLSTPQTTTVDVSTQVDTSDEQPIQLAIASKTTESGSLMLHSVDDTDMSDSTASAPPHSKGKEVDTTPCHEALQGIDDDPFLMQPDDSPITSTDIAQATQTDLATSDAPASTEPQEPRNETPLTSRSGSPPENLAIGSFSPADWRKSSTSLSSAAEGPPPTIPLTRTPSQNTSYIIPPFPEGTVAALRKEVLVDPYPYPLESTGLGGGNGLVLTMAGVVGANSVEAAQRMPSPESQCEEDDMIDDVDDSPEETSTPKVCDTQRSESKQPSSPTPQPYTRHVEKSTESTPVPPPRVMALLRQKSVSTTTESSLTSLSSDRSTPSSNVEEDSNTPRPPSPEQVQPSTPVATSFPTHPASQTSNITEDEDTVMTLVMDALPTSPACPPPAQTAFSPLRLSASPLVLVSPEPGRTRPTHSPESDDEEDKVGLMRLQEWYRQQAVKLQSKPEGSITPARPEKELMTTTTTTTQNVCSPERDNPILGPASPLFSSPNVSPRGPTDPIGDHSTDHIDDITCNDASGHDHSDSPPPISPLFTLASVSPHLPKENVQPEPPSYLKKLVETVSDDDADIVPLERNRTPSTTAGKSLLGSETGKEKSTPPPSQPPQPPTVKLFSTQIKRQTSKAKTRIKKRKVSQDPPTIEVLSEDEDEEDQPPLKRVKLRLGKAPTPSSGSGSKTTSTTTNKKVAPASSSAKKPKSVTIVSPVKTPRRRARGQQPRISTVVWPKLDKPVFDQFIECDICERWYHVGCVGIHPDDIRLSASEIYRCPPCDSGVAKEDLTPIPTVKADKQDDACARPRCLCPRRKSQSIKKESTFTVESFVGMVKKAVGGRGIKLVYLVKWQGYGYEDATWEEEAAMGLPNPGFFVERFEEQARDEGIDLTLCNSQASLLKCAVEAGWKPDGLFIRK